MSVQINVWLQTFLYITNNIINAELPQIHKKNQRVWKHISSEWRWWLLYRMKALNILNISICWITSQSLQVNRHVFCLKITMNIMHVQLFLLQICTTWVTVTESIPSFRNVHIYQSQKGWLININCLWWYNVINHNQTVPGL